MIPTYTNETQHGSATDPLLIPLDEARRELGGIGKTTIHAMIAAGELEAVKLGRRTMVVTASCRAKVASLPRLKTVEAA